MPGTFEIYKDKKGEFRFRLKSSNGQIVASGESYATKAQAKKGVEAVQLACTSAAVYGFLGDAEAMMPFARRCFTSVNGYPIAYLNDPEFAWRKNDPRMKALAARQVAR